MARTPTPDELRRREDVRAVVRRRQRQLRLTIEEIADRTGLHRNSVSEFLAGDSERWPYRSSLVKYDVALEWDEGTISRMLEKGIDSLGTHVAQTPEPEPESIPFGGLVHMVDPTVWATLDDTERRAALAAAEQAFLEAVIKFRRARE